MVEIELNGQKVSVPEGSMVMHAAEAAGTYIPHFCYHKKLSIAASCRMCLVEVEKAPKPLPACATPVTQGMIVHTKSEKALAAQRSVMEFLLINHPLDCPICDQGGECQLQDLAVGYGPGVSRYAEEKRVVFHKNVGPLVSMQEMSRCIHCTRCVRFGQEIAGVMELGMLHRGEHAEITTFVGQTVDSELSGNMIDVCPVGALTSKPFRYSARTWELARRKSVSPHDATGSNLIVQVKGQQVMRVVPLENDAINECWITDRDRFSYEALNSAQRLQMPRIKQGGHWQEVDWSTALNYVADGLRRVQAEFGSSGIGAVASELSTAEELLLLQQLMQGLGTTNIGTQTRVRDARGVLAKGQARGLSFPISELSTLSGALVVGSLLRSEHPLFAVRLRQAAKAGASIHRLHSIAQDWAMPLAYDEQREPHVWPQALAELASALGQIKGESLDLGVAVSASALSWAQSLLDQGVTTVLLGAQAQEHPQASELHWLCDRIAQLLAGRCAYLPAQGSSVVAQMLGVAQSSQGLTAAQMLSQPMKALFLLNVDAEQEGIDTEKTRAALKGSGLVVSLNSFADANEQWADVILPIAPFTETGGSFVNAQGTLQTVQGVVSPLGQTRPAWKVLRVLGNILQLQGFEQNTVQDVTEQVLAVVNAGKINNNPSAALTESLVKSALAQAQAYDLTVWPAYQNDVLVRRASALQQTKSARGLDLAACAVQGRYAVRGALATISTNPQ